LTQGDVAKLTGYTETTISDLELGKLRNPSPELLESVASALRMRPDERKALWQLATGHAPPVLAYETGAFPELNRLVDILHPQPAFVTDAVFRVCASNEATAEWFGDFGACDVQPSFAVWFFCHPHAGHVFVRPQRDLASRILSRLRWAAAQFPDDPAVTDVIDQLRGDDFVEELWTKEAGVYHTPATEKRLLRRPGHTDPRQSDDADHQVEAVLYTLALPRPDDERRVFILALPETEPHRPGIRSEEVCVACQRQ
jgi:transcriptional regulator with XRE-family HTH domain